MLIFHTMGNVADVQAALSAQGISFGNRAAIETAIIDISWSYSRRGYKAHDNFQIDPQYGAVMPTSPGNVVVPCGSKALAIYQQAGIVKKNVGIEKCRAAYHPYYDGFFTASYDPNRALPDFVAGFRADAAVAHRVAITGVVEPTFPVPIERVETVNDLLDSLENYPELGGMSLSVDTETMGLDPYKKGKHIVAVSLTWKRDAEDFPRCQVIYTNGFRYEQWVALAAGLQKLLNHPRVRVIGANLKYDSGWFAIIGVHIGNLVFDTMLGGSMVNENRWNSLNQHTKTYTDFGGYDDVFNAKHDKAEMEKVPIHDVIQYAGGDTLAAHYAARPIIAELKKVSRSIDGKILKKSPYNFYMKVLHPAARAFELVEQRGMYVDKERFDDFGEWCVNAAADYKTKLTKLLPQKVKSRYEDWETFKPVLVSHYLFDHSGITPKQYTEKSGKPSTAWSHLQSFQDDPKVGEFVKALKEFNALKKLHSTYYIGWLKHLRDDGLFHPTYWLHRAARGDEGGAVTGRSSVTNPAVQTLPKHSEVAKRLRKCFIAPEGYYIAGLDYSQGELRIVACVACETQMLMVYEQGGDLHAVTASNMLKMPLHEFVAKAESDPVWFEAARRNGKAGNFGLVYGMKAEGYQTYAWEQYGVVLDLESAEEQRNTFFKAYPKLLTYHDTQTTEVRRHGEVMSPLGRVRHLPHIWCDDQFFSSKARRQAINSPIQSCLSDMSFWSIGLLHQHFPHLWVWGMIHDQNLLYVRKEAWREEIETAKTVMENLPFEETFDWKPQLNFPVDALVGPSLGELYDVGNFDG